MQVVEGGNHWHEFIDAVRGTGPKPSANFDYSGHFPKPFYLEVLPQDLKMKLSNGMPQPSHLKIIQKQVLLSAGSIVKDGK